MVFLVLALIRIEGVKMKILNFDGIVELNFKNYPYVYP